MAGGRVEAHFGIKVTFERLAGGPSTFTLHTGSSSEGFRLNSNGNFTTAFKNVTAVHAYTGVGTYQAKIKLLSQSPATITTTTPNITGRLQIQNFDNTPAEPEFEEGTDTRCDAQVTNRRTKRQTVSVARVRVSVVDPRAVEIRAGSQAYPVRVIEGAIVNDPKRG